MGEGRGRGQGAGGRGPGLGVRGQWAGGRGRVPAALTLLAVEDRQQAEHEGPAGGREEAPPVIPDREVRGHDLDAEQDAWGRQGAESLPPGQGHRLRVLS